MPGEQIVWQLGLFGLPITFAVASIWLGIAHARQANWWRAGGLAAAWVGLMAAFLATGATRVHGPDLAYLGLVFATPALAALFGLGVVISKMRR